MTTVERDSDSDDDAISQNGSIGARPKESMTTDRYGFTGGNQFTKEGDIAIPVSVLRKREMKWLDMLDDWDKWMTKKPRKVKERCRKGIPSSLRARAWQRLCGGKKLMEKNHLRFQELDNMKGDPKWVEVIIKDLDRQFPFHEMFAEKGGSGQQDLFRILKAYSLYNPRDGYCQAMAPVAAVLLMHMTAEEAFWCFVQICDRYLTGYYSPGLEAVQVDGEVLHLLLKKLLPSTYKHMRKHCIDPILYMTEWFMCIFARTLPWTSVLRVWDMFLFEGVKVLFRVSLVILKNTLSSSDNLRKHAGLYETMQVLKNIPPEYLAEEFLVDEMLKIHVFEKDLESEHSLTVARRNAMRSRQLSKDSAADMLKSIEALKKKKKKVRPPQSTEADETRSMISLVGYGNESPVRHKKEKKKKKTKERDPGVTIYKQTVKPAWSEPELMNSNEQLSQSAVPYQDQTRIRDASKREYNEQQNLIANRVNSKSESALNVSANYKLAQAPSVDSNIHEETLDASLSDSRKGSARADQDRGVDTSPSKSSGAIQGDSDSSGDILEFQDPEDTDLVVYVRQPHDVSRRKPSMDETPLVNEGHFPQYTLQLPGETVDNHEEFEAKFEKKILDLSFDGDEAIQQSSSAESDLKFESPVEEPSSLLDPPVTNINGATLNVNSRSEMEDVTSDKDLQTLSDKEVAGDEENLPPFPSSPNYGIDTGPSTVIDGQVSSEVTGNGEKSILMEGIPSENSWEPSSHDGYRDSLDFPLPPPELEDLNIQEEVDIWKETTHDAVSDMQIHKESTLDPTIKDGASTLDPTIKDGASSLDPTVQDGASTLDPTIKDGASTLDPTIKDGASSLDPTVQDGASTLDPTIKDGASTLDPTVQDGASTLDPTVQDGAINGPEVTIPPPGIDEDFEEKSRGTELSVQATERDAVLDEMDDIRESLDVLPLSETDSSSVSDGRTNGGSLNGVGDPMRSLTEDLDDLENVNAEVITRMPQEEFQNVRDINQLASNGGLRIKTEEVKVSPIPPPSPPRPPPPQNVESDLREKETLAKLNRSVHPNKPPVLPRRDHAADRKIVTGHSRAGTEGKKDVQMEKRESPRPRLKSGKKPVPLPKKKGLERKVVKAPTTTAGQLGNSIITDQL